MPRYALLISDRARGAYFEAAHKVALAEIGLDAQLACYGDLAFAQVTAEPGELPRLLRASAVQGAFEVVGDGLVPLDKSAQFALHPDFVFGEKYRGKTNESFTQLMINMGLCVCPHAESLADPMAGRGTTLMWAMRYGLSAVGVEQDKDAIPDWRRGLKKWTKLHRQKHKMAEGWVQKANKQGTGKFLDFTAAGVTARMVIGDTAEARALLLRKRFDLIVTDIPYGVQHMGGKAARSPFETLVQAAPGWAQSLAPGGAMVIGFNSYQPKRAALAELFTAEGLTEIPSDLEHRMSESILRDVLILRK